MLNALEDAYDTRKAMGVFGEKCVDKYQFSSKELDDFSLTSLTRAKKASEDGTFFARNCFDYSKTWEKTIEVIHHDKNALKANPEKSPI
ncbi:hypothetical protein [Coxiella-like endosymbiont]|uniref:thiolase family protein n=1 Tax=Coxiella-like endosymbiont TaxID=1592897 RepID=UPI00272B1F8D|nr:hypothetical protein [Coxiella-like endosymbiont]